MAEEPQKFALVVDNGSGTIKAGFAGDDAPRSVFPNMHGKPKAAGMARALATKDVYVGEDANAKRGVLTISFPIVAGLVNNWDEMEVVWHHTFYNELDILPEEHPILLTDAPMTPRAHRERMTLIMFATFDAPALFIVMQAVLTLYASGRTTGVVVDSGAGVTHVVPIYESYAVSHGIDRLEVGGGHLTDYMAKILTERGFAFTNVADRQALREIKEKFTYVSQDFEAEMEQAAGGSSQMKMYKMPDGETEISIRSERFRCPEVLFKPDLAGVPGPGLHEVVFDTIGKCEAEIRPELFVNLVLSGGSAQIHGMSGRLEAELYELMPIANPIGITVAPGGTHSVWLGGSILASLDTFENMWISRQEYEEAGPSIVSRKCF